MWYIGVLMITTTGPAYVLQPGNYFSTTACVQAIVDPVRMPLCKDRSCTCFKGLVVFVG